MNQIGKAGLCVGAAPAMAATSAEPATVADDTLALAPVGTVRIDGEIGSRLDLCVENRVMTQDIDRLVKPFRDREEQDYGGFRCEYWGKWFTSAALAYAYQPTPEHRAKLDDAVRALLETQSDDGYIGTYQPEHQLGGWDIWGRKYVLHGLLAHHEVTGDPAVLEAASRALDYFIAQVRGRKVNLAEMGFPGWVGLPPTSILEPVVLLHQRTGNPDYLAFAREIVASWETSNDLDNDGLRLIEQALAGAPPAAMGASKAYEMMSCYEGLCELYRSTGEATFRDAAVALANGVRVAERMVTGSGSNHELWCEGARYQTELLEQPVETCVTATWMKLCCQLLRLTGDPVWADELELSLYNALLSAMMPDGAWWSYYAPLAGERVPSHPQHHDVGLSCCVASGPRALMLTPRWAVMSDAGGPVVNLYAPGTARVTLAGGTPVDIQQETAYPVEAETAITLRLKEPTAFVLRLRIPAWSEQTVLTVNGETHACSPGTYARLERTWSDGDVVRIQFDMRGRALPAPSGAPQYAVMRGPVVLALDNRITAPRDTAVRLLQDSGGRVELTPITPAPEGMWMAFTAPFEVRPSHVFNHHQVALALCDYASAGNGWSPESRFRVWLPQPLFLAEAYPANTWRMMYPDTTERPVVPGTQEQ